MTPNKACPVVFHDSSYSRILVFKHPMAGIQLVKGTIEQGEEPGQAAFRELCEESGIRRSNLERDLGVWDSGFENQVWSIHLCSTVDPLPESWVHHTNDGGGWDLEFYWHPVQQPPDQNWHLLFQLALKEILERLRNSF